MRSICRYIEIPKPDSMPLIVVLNELKKRDGFLKAHRGKTCAAIPIVGLDETPDDSFLLDLQGIYSVQTRPDPSTKGYGDSSLGASEFWAD